MQTIPDSPDIAYRTELGCAVNLEIVKFLESEAASHLHGAVQLILFSPPFPLNRKKAYGNLNGEDYLKWLSKIGVKLKDLLTSDGSLVIEIGNAWNSGSPTMSTLPLKTLISFTEVGGYKLCQQFVWNNVAKLPGPVEWVNKRRIRVKDAFTHIWWLSKSDYPKANNSNVLTPYSPRMTKLLKRQSYNAGSRPSQHVIGATSFLSDNNGAIPSNVLCSANTSSQDAYHQYCRKLGIPPHPARMPEMIPEFFIRMLTDESDLVLDPFSGSNTTGAVSEQLKRKWISIEENNDYMKGSKGRFVDL